MALEAVEVGGAVAVAIAFMETVKLLVAKIPGRNGRKAQAHLSPEAWELMKSLARGVDQLLQIHAREDDDGVPLYLIPRLCRRDQAEMTKALQSISTNQEQSTRILAELVSRVGLLNSREPTSPGTSVTLPRPLSSTERDT